MTPSLQEWRIGELEKEVHKLKNTILAMSNERQMLMGMGKMARWGIRALFVLGGYGSIRFAHDIVRWLSTPWK